MRNSQIILCSGILMDRNYKNVVAYTKEQLQNLINDKKVLQSNNCSFIKETGEIIVDFNYNDALTCDYMAYQNPDYSNKWFYAWIDKITYKSENSVKIEYTIDAFSTWYTDTNKKQCFVIREHVSDDTIGAHTIPENLELGEYKIASKTEVSNLKNCRMVLASTTSPRNTEIDDKPIISGLPSGVGYYSYGINIDGSAQLERDLVKLTNDGKIDGVQGIFIAPTDLSYTQNNGDLIGNSYSPNHNIINIPSFSSVIDSYQPKNNKCWCYPYCYTLVTNGAGGSMILKPELWYDRSHMQFQVDSVLSVGCSIVGYPLDYDGDAENYDESLPLGKYPTLNWSTDLFVNWCTENALNVSYGVLNGGLSATMGLVSGNPTQTAQGVQTIGQSLYSEMMASRIPPHFAGNLNCGDVNFSSGRNTYRIEHKTVRYEYIRAIDDFFTRFGYKINRLKNPAIQSRTHWNFVQIGDGEIYAYSGAPSEYIDIINQAFRNGVTLWHNHDEIGNFSLNNTIRS